MKHGYGGASLTRKNAGADCPRYGPSGPDPIWIHGSCPWILLAVYFGWLCIFSIFHIGLPPHGTTYNLVPARRAATRCHLIRRLQRHRRSHPSEPPAVLVPRDFCARLGRALGLNSHRRRSREAHPVGRSHAQDGAVRIGQQRYVSTRTSAVEDGRVAPRQV